MSEKEELRAMFQELTEYEKQKVGLGIDGLPGSCQPDNMGGAQGGDDGCDR